MAAIFFHWKDRLRQGGARSIPKAAGWNSQYKAGQAASAAGVLEFCPAGVFERMGQVQYAFLSERGAQRELAAWVSAFGKMITIPESADWIPVDSAFGGLAIYRRAILAGARYSGADENGEPVCEHVPLHKQLRARGARIFINPRLIDTSYTENSRQRTLTHILKRGWLSLLRRVRHGR